MPPALLALSSSIEVSACAPTVNENETADEGKVEFGKGEVDVPQQGDWVFRPLASDR